MIIEVVTRIYFKLIHIYFNLIEGVISDSYKSNLFKNKYFSH